MVLAVVLEVELEVVLPAEPVVVAEPAEREVFGPVVAAAPEVAPEVAAAAPGLVQVACGSREVLREVFAVPARYRAPRRYLFQGRRKSAH